MKEIEKIKRDNKIKKEFLSKGASMEDVKELVTSGKKKYVVFNKYPKIKIPIEDGKISLDFQNKKLGGWIEF